MLNFEALFSVNLQDYFPDASDFPLNVFLLCMGIGLILACFAMHYYKRLGFLFIKQLLRAEAKDVATAKSLTKLGLGKNRALARMLETSGPLKRAYSDTAKTVSPYGEEGSEGEAEKEAAPDVQEEVKYYISEENRPYAESVFERDGGSVVRPILAAVLILAVCYALMLASPTVLSWLSAA